MQAQDSGVFHWLAALGWRWRTRRGEPLDPALREDIGLPPIPAVPAIPARLCA